jgi:hypothetical protein
MQLPGLKILARQETFLEFGNAIWNTLLSTTKAPASGFWRHLALWMNDRQAFWVPDYTITIWCSSGLVHSRIAEADVIIWIFYPSRDLIVSVIPLTLTSVHKFL